MTTHEVPHSVRRADERAREIPIMKRIVETPDQRRAFLERVFALVTAHGTIIRPSKGKVGDVYMSLCDGRDACEPTAEECFRVLFEAEDHTANAEPLRCSRCDREHDGSVVDERGVSEYCSDACLLADRAERGMSR